MDVSLIWIVASIQVNFAIANCLVARLLPCGMLCRRRLSRLNGGLVIPKRFPVGINEHLQI